MYFRLLPLGESRTSDSFSSTLENLTDDELFDSIVGPSPIGIGSTSNTSALLFTTGQSSIGVDSIGKPPYVLHGTSDIGISSSSNTHITLWSDGIAPIGLESTTSSGTSLEPYPGDNGLIYIPVELAGIMNPIFPRPSPPIDFTGLTDPTAAPTVIKSTTANGKLVAGTYRYSYAAWKGSTSLVTAPSPAVDIALTTENTVSVTVLPIAEADGYLIYREDL